MGEHKKVVEVPKLDRNPYNPLRPVSDLVKNQVLHLSLAERHLKPEDQTGIDVHSIQTEEDAARYIHHLTAKLHPQGRKVAKPGKKKTTSKFGKQANRNPQGKSEL
jgi:hypothetical protein